MSGLVGLYPGTFDPITVGHLDIIQRAVKVVDHLIVGVARNDNKGPLFSTAERVEMVKADIADAVKGGATIEVRPFDKLLVSFAETCGARILIRGLRAVSDFEYEFQMASMNYRLSPTIETVFLMASDRHQFISSSFVKEIGRFGGDIRHFVSPRVAAQVRLRFGLPELPPRD
ncbi:pantetheine-phosphate adenylyltransferase [Radicibacter daui]|uniref:pantetheine-phosphate adenylyltransferase n=1 Tax=Radicibacter daui TaxID=3064829 RepID=UPI004046A68E